MIVTTPKCVDAVLAVCFKSGAIYLMSNYDDLHPRIIYTHLKGTYIIHSLSPPSLSLSRSHSLSLHILTIETEIEQSDLCINRI